MGVINVIVDYSGSFYQLGKIDILSSTMLSILGMEQDGIFGDNEVHYFIWQYSVVEELSGDFLSLFTGGLPVPEGNNEVDSLVAFIQSREVEDVNILITDACYGVYQWERISDLSSMQRDRLVLVLAGYDANDEMVRLNPILPRYYWHFDLLAACQWSSVLAGMGF